MRQVPLRMLLDPVRPLTYGIVQAGPHIDGGIPYIRPVDMTENAGVRDPAALQCTSEKIASAYARSSLRAGDIVLSIGPSYGKVMQVPDALNGANLTQGTARLAPGCGVDPRWLMWVLQSKPSRAFWDAVSAGGTFRALNLGPLGETPVSLVSPDEQSRIADFLDERVARIDQIIAARDGQVRKLAEMEKAEIELVITSATTTNRPLQSLTDPARPIRYGIVLPGPHVEGGVPIIKGGDIASGRLQRRELNRTAPEIEKDYIRSRVKPGDLVIAIRGSVGEVAEVPTGLELANLTQDVARISAHGCDSDWLRAVLEAPTTQSAIAHRVTGATVKGINIGDLRRVPIPVPPPADQARIGAAIHDARLQKRASITALQASSSLLTNYKQALITAAVTGGLDVTTAASGIPG